MAQTSLIRDDPWLTHPITIGETTILAAGQVADVPGIDPKAMRVMGSYGLIYMADVEGYYHDANGTKSTLRSGDVVWIHPGLGHAYGPKPGRSWRQIYLILDGAQWTQWANAGVMDPGRPLTHAEPVDYWRRRFRDTYPKEGVHDRAGMLRVMGATLQLVLDLLAAQEEAERSVGDTWLIEGKRLLGNRNQAEILTPHLVAQRVGLSYESFRKRFATRVGVSPGQYQKQRRIEHACAVIYQGQRSFKALADELGFCDVFHFSKAFRQITGETPSNFRRRVRGG